MTAPHAYYNDNDPYVCAWLSNLMDAGHITPGTIDDRSIELIDPASLRGYERVHLFAGIAGWELALNLAGWQGPVWTGSCPCQPFSSAARGRHTQADLWPVWRSLIAECSPSTVLGEQVAHARHWFDGVCDDMERLGYAIGASLLPACAVGVDHARHRIFFVGHTDRGSKPSVPVNGKMARMPGNRSEPVHLAQTNGISADVAQMRAYGNAIVPQVAAEFVSAFMEATHA